MTLLFLRQVVLAETSEGGWVAIGPVRNESTVEKLREEAEEHGWTVRGSIPIVSAAEFRAERAAS